MKKFARIVVKGGVLSLGELQKILRLCEALNLSYLHFGSRQDIVLPIYEIDEKIQLDCNLEITLDGSVQNIVSSYVSAGVFKGTKWLNSSKYLYILEHFKTPLHLKVNITDPRQSIVPIFNGNLNFIASEKEDYWHLNIQLPHWAKQAYYPKIIFSFDIAKICQLIERFYRDCINEKELFEKIDATEKLNSPPTQPTLVLPVTNFPFYEGIQKISADDYWLGLYWKNNRYDVDFLRDLMLFCLERNIAKINLTPWKSFLIKGLKESDIAQIEHFLGKRGITLRHSALDLGWHLPVADEFALQLKEKIVIDLQKRNISTQGISFSIASKGSKKLFTMIVIESNDGLFGKKSYQVKYAKNFNEKTQQYITYVQDASEQMLPELLTKLCRKYFETQKKHITTQEKINEYPLYQCEKCHTIYDGTLGDKTQKIMAETPFEKLPNDYKCPICGSGKISYKIKNILQEHLNADNY